MRSFLATLILRLTGWKIEGKTPTMSKYVIIAAPHTSNWDFVYTMLLSAHFKLDMRWMGKHSLFRPPFGWFFRLAGGLPVDRRERNQAVAKAVDLFQHRERLALVIAPEGTRQKTTYWKTGFYYIAQGAGVPIVLGYVDFSRKCAGIGPTFIPTGNIEADMKQIQEFYAPMRGKNADWSGDIKLRDQTPSE